MPTIGAAQEFWRLRLTRVDTTEDLDFEWHEDILYREPAVTTAGDVELWHVEAVRLEDADSVTRLSTFEVREDAEAYFDRVTDDLRDLTRSQFEDAYIVPAHQSSDEA